MRSYRFKVDLTEPNALREYEPEHRLLIAVLQRAIQDYLQDRWPRDRECARDWFRSNERDYPCSFLYICGELELPADKILLYLLEAKSDSKNSAIAFSMRTRQI